MKIKVSSVLAGLVFCNSISAVVIREDEMSQLHSLKNLTRHDTSNQQKKSSNRLLKPVSFSAPPASVFPTIEHPYPPVYADYNYNKVVPTNSWISNLFYPSVNHLAPTTPDPYILRLLDDFGGNPGLTISQPHDKVIGSYSPTNNVPASPAGYIINGVVADFRITSSEWKDETPNPLVTSWDMFGANLKLSGAGGHIEFPIARGASFITSIYNNLTPQFYTQHAIIRVSADNNLGDDTYSGHKFKVSFNDNPTSTFIIYVLGDQPLTLKKVGFSNLVSPNKFNGVIQVAKLPDSPESETLLDNHKGAWATGASVDTNIDSTSYAIRWNLKGDTSKQLLAYAYPHHITSFIQDNEIRKTDMYLQSSSKGPMRAVIGNTWTMREENLPTTEWFPAQPVPQESTRNEIMENMVADVSSNYTENTQKGDNYFSGKGLQKYALLALTLNKPEMTKLRDGELAKTSLDKLKEAFVPYLENRQQNPYRYDTLYRGIVSKDGLPVEMGGTGDIYSEFGHTYYNDHHYHQGYLVVTAAIIHYLDPAWRTAEIKDWTETLIRDVNNPVDNDPYFAQFRNWDWFSGHSWAGGIKVNGALDGRDQESVPESVNFYWGSKLWGLATNNKDMTDLANLQLAITKRSTYEYFWFKDDNKNRPAEMVKNKVAGIFFEQKVDYTTYFGRYLEFIHGIQQLPMTPILADYIRVPEFVTQEWNQKLSSVAPTVTSPWAGVLYLNYALINPSDAYPTLRNILMDDGQTRAYSLYIAATRPGFYRRSYSKHLQERNKKLLKSAAETEQPIENSSIVEVENSDQETEEESNKDDEVIVVLASDMDQDTVNEDINILLSNIEA